MRHFLFAILLSFSCSASALEVGCPDLNGQYVCSVQSENDVAASDFRLDVSFAYDGAPTYYLSSPTMAIPQTTYIANDLVHPGISPELSYRASCSEKKLIVKFYVEKRAIDVRIYSKNKTGFQVDTLSGNQEVCVLSPLNP